MKVAERYRALVDAGELKVDADQQRAVDALQRVQEEIEARPEAPGFFAKLMGKRREPVRGLYLWGGVGRGKSMLMDLFYECVDTPHKARAHFHEFMIDVDRRLAAERAKNVGDPVAPVVAQLADEARLFCFDEMHITNTADAAIMGRLFGGLIEAGVTVVTTSNRPPEDLFKDGLNRTLVTGFITLVQERLDILPLDGPTDYRRARLGDATLWHCPNGDVATEELSEAFFRLTDYPPSDAQNVPSEDIDLGGGRSMHVPKALKGVAVFSFKRLCGEPRGAADYLAIARRYHTVIIVGIPVLGPENQDQAARFVKLIDALYEYRVKLLASADAAPEALYPEGPGSFEFERTISRLSEMRSDAYLALGHGSEG
ncbi:cell division protein ZapE [Novosphingopyxis sp. YJ-S2-01]|uniref:cell division protein ZapE n=1 Tax=Novosphingopyxis sp. YJ-S2-01 TaxID=2794021 RepID=UPI0018DC4478|nr:AFG1 family ATPase [Novosphingopyxis sp. YJ-S2-01]